MVRYTFFVKCKGWKNGGYSNTHFARNEKEARENIAESNRNGGNVELISIEEISLKEFNEDWMRF